ncbi:hypothetical protein [Cylindrospermopsis raciborskii]|uniref:hypothetical protein n=1 Tax=Cylindrospermopsis raciborskii TaxID=77022 RepID=UPI002119F008|nr:hypothetical protein [Cylindrospermopsis raciborskii]
MKIYSYLLFPAVLSSLAFTTSVKAEKVSAKATDLIGGSANLLAQSSNPGVTPASPTTTPSNPSSDPGVTPTSPITTPSNPSSDPGVTPTSPITTPSNPSSDPGVTPTSPITTPPTPLYTSGGDRVIKLRLSDTGVSIGGVLAWGLAGLIQKRSTDWVRLEIRDTKVRVVHTTRVTNWFTQFSKWWDHPVRKIMFKSDSCESNTCTISGEDGIIDLKDTRLLHQGTFQVEYLENNEWKYAAFRVPENNL